MFDRLLLLSSQGQTLYFGDIGPHATSVVEYFEDKGAPKFSGASANPAEWMLDIMNGDDVDQWSAKYISSAQTQQNASPGVEHSDEKSAEDIQNREAPRLEKQYAATIPRQMFLVTKQVCLEYWRDPTYMYSKMALCTGLVRTHSTFQTDPRTLAILTHISQAWQ